MKLYARKTGSGQGVIADEETGKTIAVTYNEEDAFMLAHRAMVHDELVEALKFLHDDWVTISGVDHGAGDEYEDVRNIHAKVCEALRNANQNNR